jgi:hypothetical protein
MKDSNVVAPAHQPAVATARRINQNSTGYLPKYADSATAITPPAPSMKTFPTCEWLTSSSDMPQMLVDISISIYAFISCREDANTYAACGSNVTAPVADP